MLEPRHLFATFGSRKLLARTEVSSDHRTLTLFYLERLPGSARIRVTFEGDGIVDHLQRPLDPDGDGVPGGTRWFEFDTLSTAPVPQTAVTGVVYASSMVVGLNGVPTNQPLKGVQIEVVGAEEVSRATTE